MGALAREGSSNEKNEAGSLENIGRKTHHRFRAGGVAKTKKDQNSSAPVGAIFGHAVKPTWGAHFCGTKTDPKDTKPEGEAMFSSKMQEITFLPMTDSKLART